MDDDHLRQTTERLKQPIPELGILTPVDCGLIEDSLHREGRRLDAIANRMKWAHDRDRKREHARAHHDLAHKITELRKAFTHAV